MIEHPQSPNSRLESLRARFNARAAGWWRISADRRQLIQIAFCAEATMPIEVASTFAENTRNVSLDAKDLGIVKAALTGRVAVSLLEELPADSGSGLWLRRFEASCSVAVPIVDDEAREIAVVSLALADRGDDAVVSRAIRETASSWHVAE